MLKFAKTKRLELWARGEPQDGYSSTELGKSSSSSLFENIKSTSEFANFVGRELHIDFLSKITDPNHKLVIIFIDH